MLRTFAFCHFLICSLSAQTSSSELPANVGLTLQPSITRKINPSQQGLLEKRLLQITEKFQTVSGQPNAADAEMFLKAVRLAIELQDWSETNSEANFQDANILLDSAELRISALAQGDAPWMLGSGRRVLGFYSPIDRSPQPYIVEIPDVIAFNEHKKPFPMLVQLDDWGKNSTDLRYIVEARRGKAGETKFKRGIVIHPYVHNYSGFSAVDEAYISACMTDAFRRFNIDQSRIAMVGSGTACSAVWQMGTHFPEKWSCIYADAADTDRVKPSASLGDGDHKAAYNLILGKDREMSVCARNLLGVPLTLYSGSFLGDKTRGDDTMQMLRNEGGAIQHLSRRQADDISGSLFSEEGLRMVEAAIVKERPLIRDKLSIQTQTLRYNRISLSSDRYISVFGLARHWDESRVEVEWRGDSEVHVTTRNVELFDVGFPKGARIVIDGQIVRPWINRGVPRGKGWRPRGWVFARSETGRWREVEIAIGTAEDRGEVTQDLAASAPVDKELSVNKQPMKGLAKRPTLQGPIDDAFSEPFMFVIPDGVSPNPLVDLWVNRELKLAIRRWKGMMRGEIPIKKASEVTASDYHYNLILWGSPESNSLVAKLVGEFPIGWNRDTLSVAGLTFSAATSVPCLIYPNPRSPSAYVVLNSGASFLADSDDRNSQQQLKLPDWAVLDVRAYSASKVLAADFFDEHWKLEPYQQPSRSQ